MTLDVIDRPLQSPCPLHHGRGRNTMGSPIGHFEILGTHAGRLRAFYTGIFGWAVKPPPEEADPLAYTMISTGAGAGALEGGIARNPEGRGPRTFSGHVDNLP